MKPLSTFLFSIVLFSLTSSCQKDEVGENFTNESTYLIDLDLAKETNWIIADEILVLINEHRGSIGLSEIKRDSDYSSAYAVEHTKNMIEENHVSHDNFNVRSAALKERGAYYVAENVAAGYANANDVVRAWLNSPSHRKIIEGSYTHSGFGVVMNNSGIYFFTQLFSNNNN